MSIEAYNVLLFLAVHAAVLLTELRLRRRGETLLGRPWILLLALCGGLVGGRIHYAVEGLWRGTVSTQALPRLISPLSGGSTFFGAMAGVVLVLILVRAYLPRGSVLHLADAAVPGFAVAIGIGRVGCFANGCCLGAPVAGLALHPLVLYLGAAALAAGFLATRSPIRAGVGDAPGQSFLLFAVLFSAARFALEALRLPLPGEVRAINVARWESLLVVVVLVPVLFIRSRAGRRATFRGRGATHRR